MDPLDSIGERACISHYSRRGCLHELQIYGGTIHVFPEEVRVLPEQTRPTLQYHNMNMPCHAMQMQHVDRSAVPIPFTQRQVYVRPGASHMRNVADLAMRPYDHLLELIDVVVVVAVGQCEPRDSEVICLKETEGIGGVTERRRGNSPFLSYFSVVVSDDGLHP